MHTVESMRSSSRDVAPLCDELLGTDINLMDELSGMRILVVDDMPTQLKLLRASLFQGGFRNTVAAQGGIEALECLRQSVQEGVSDIDAVLLDIWMMDLDGYFVCRRMRAMDGLQDIPVVMITAHDRQGETVRHAYRAGATDLLFKPLRDVELWQRLRSTLFLKRERDLRKRREQELKDELMERQAIEARLHYLLSHDDLTGLYNRRQLETDLTLAVQHARQYGVTSALLYLDLDQFRIVNELEGHAAGDRLLLCVANALRERFGRLGNLARIGSDEYTLLLERTDLKGALECADAVRCFLKGFSFSGYDTTYHIGASIGVAFIHQEGGLTASQVLAQADQACFAAKSKGRNCVHLYNQDDKTMLHLKRDAYWVPRIRRALVKNEFRLVCQPLLCMSDGFIHRYEVLIRMLGEEGELLLPLEFIRVAERMGLIQDIDRWVVKHTLIAMSQLPLKHRDLCFNINLSGYAFQHPKLLPLIHKCLQATDVAAERITFEITETAAITNLDKTRAIVNKLRALGCRFALDDFGAGFNTYSYLKQLPVDYLKIDGSFITNLADDPVDQVLVKSMIEIAHALGKAIIAEFVETRETLKLLRGYGVDFAQGNYIGEPVPNVLKAG
jgi:diguanylate cyclase (GGDEF) domain